MALSVISAYFLTVSPEVKAETIQSALASAYANNPELAAQRARVRVVDEGLSLAKSGYFPTIEGNADYGYSRSRSFLPGVIQNTSLNPRGFGIAFSQPLFDGLKTLNNIKSAEAAIEASRQTLRNVEQNVLFEAASAYMNVVRDRAVTTFRSQNLEFLKEEVRAAQERFNVGEGTRTDVAQARARKASAIAQLAAARAQLKGAVAVYRQVIGHDPRNLKLVKGIGKFLPRDLDVAIAIAQREHPAILANHFLVSRASYDVESARGDLLPKVSLQASASRRHDFNGRDDRINSGAVTVKLVVPIYQGGRVSAQIRQNREILGQRRIEVDQAVDRVRAGVISAFAQLQSAQATITASVAQLGAAKLALEGVIEERSVGQRTTLDVLNTRQSVINAQITLTGARRDLVVSGYALLSAMGRLNAEQIKLFP